MNNHYDYQDIWIRGQVKKKGNRECEQRYQCIKNYLRPYKGLPLKILDFGANNGYFGFRIAWDNPEYDVYLVDYNNYLPRIVDQNQLENVHLFHQYMDENQLIDLDKKYNFDLILLMSVLHHFENPVKVIKHFTMDTRKTIFEVSYPEEDVISNPHNKMVIWDCLQDCNPIQLNLQTDHDRPLFYTDKNSIKLQGKIHNGCGVASRVISNDISEGLFQTTYKRFYPGTLNVTLEKLIRFKNLSLVSTYYKIFPMSINGLLVYGILTYVKGDTTKELEIISEYGLRDMFNYQDGDELTVAINKRFIDQIFV